jgi:stalled ribosome rescue protein Dom34
LSVKPVHISQAAPIRVMTCSAWMLEDSEEELPNLLLLVGPDFKAQQVIDLVKSLYPEYEKFTVQCVSVGSYEIKEQVGDVYFNDARSVDQDGIVDV